VFVVIFIAKGQWTTQHNSTPLNHVCRCLKYSDCTLGNVKLSPLYGIVNPA